MLWKKVNSAAGRVVYQYMEDENDQFSLMGIIDYDPARPRYKAQIFKIGLEPKWFDDLDEAKEWVESTFITIQLGEL